MSARKHWQDTAEEAILDHFRTPEHEPFHSDDLWHLIPDEHRSVISLAVMALVNKKLIVGTGVYRKSAIPSRKRSPSQEYRLTERGRDRIAGHRAGGRGEPGGEAGPITARAANATPSSVSGEPHHRPTGAPTSKESGRATNPPVPSASDQSSPVAESASQPAAGENLSLLPDPDREVWAA